MVIYNQVIDTVKLYLILILFLVERYQVIW